MCWPGRRNALRRGRTKELDHKGGQYAVRSCSLNPNRHLSMKPNLPLCIILRSDAHWLSLGGPYPSSDIAIVASQKAGLSLLFIGEDSPSTLIIDKVAISTRSVLAISSSDADQKPAQTPGGFWVNPERGAVAELALQWLNFLRSCSVSAEARRAPPRCS